VRKDKLGAATLRGHDEDGDDDDEDAGGGPVDADLVDEV
jgi:hypothetical protein